MQKTKKAIRILTLTLLALLTGLFALWVFSGAQHTAGELFAAALSALLFAVCGIRFVPKMFADAGRESLAPDAALGRRTNRFSRRHPWVQLVVFVLLSRIAVYVLAYAICTLVQGYQGGVLDTLESIWVRSDANSYLGIAENWYVNEGDPRFHIVFLPFYPIAVKGFSFLTGSYFAAALLVSDLTAAAAACFAYELFALDERRRGALRAVKFLFLLPAAFFFNAPMTESLFLLLSIASLYLCRRRRFLPACVLAAFAGFTRSVGALLLLPIALEMICFVQEEARKTPRPEKLTARAVGIFSMLLLVPLGLAAYLAINYAVTGDALKFMEYQREHWSQGFGYFWNSAAYQTGYAAGALQQGDWRMFYGLYLPNLLCVFGALSLMIPASGRIRASYTAYFLAHFAVAIGATWLLSAPRYLTVMFPLALALAGMTKRPGWNAVLTGVFAVLQLAYLSLFVLGYPVF